jgi:hypothetical protein
MADSKAANGDKPILLVDTHVHIYDIFDIDALLDAAVANFAAAAQACGHGHAPRELMLLLTETAQDHAFARLKAGALRPVRWRVEAASEPAVLRLSRDEATSLWLVAGRQIATREDLEVVAVGTTAEFADGQPIAESIAAAERVSAMLALPWGFGKWLGKRGRIIDGLMRRQWSKLLFLTDNGGRLAMSRRPVLLREAERLGRWALPGTDPLPFPGEHRKVGTHGVVIADWESCARPLARLVEILGNHSTRLQPFGKLTGVADFVRLQVGMQVRKRWRRSPVS